MYYTYMYEFLQKNAASLGSMNLVFDILLAMAVFAGVLVFLMLVSKKKRFRFKISILLGLAGIIVFCVPYIIFIS